VSWTGCSPSGMTEALPPGTRIVSSAPRPSSRPRSELLKRKGITIRLGGLGENNGHCPWRMGVFDRADRKCWGRSERCGGPFSRTACLDRVRALAGVPGELARGRERSRAMFITSETALAVWKSCQITGVRSASAAEPGEVYRAVQSLGMNLLVVEPAGKSISWIKQLASAFRVSGAPRAPEALRVEDR